MVENRGVKVLLYVVLAALVVVGFMVGALMMNQPVAQHVPTAAEIAALVVVPAAPVQNLTGLTNQVAALSADNNWKTQAEALATAEYSRSDGYCIKHYIIKRKVNKEKR